MSASPGPLAGEKYLDVPSQRLLVIGILVATQAIKIGEFLSSDEDETPSYLLIKWSLVDAFLLWFIPLLRIPRLSFNQRARFAQILLLSSYNWILFGNYSFTWGRFLPVSIRNILSIFEYDQLAISQRRVKIQDVVDYGSHLLGQHTVRLSPISTAKFNPESLSFCLAVPSTGVFIPILLNNTRPNFIQYSIAPLADRGPRDYINITSRELAKMQSAATALFADQERLYGPPYEEDEEDEDEQAVAPRNEQIAISRGSSSRPHSNLEKTQTITYVRVTRPGLIRLERVLDISGADARIYRRSQGDTTVVECPAAKFEDDSLESLQCAGSTREVHISVRGTVPMALKWHRTIRGKGEQFLVEGIEGGTEASGLPLAQEVQIPLTLQLDASGPHVYTLDSLTDGVGNTVDFAGSGVSAKRSLTVLGRSSASFVGCGTSPDKTVDLIRTKESRLIVALKDADPDDGPWTVTVRFDPENVESSDHLASGWTKDFTTALDKKTLSILVTDPGDYTITGVRGQSCSGIILSPESCRVVEQPMPSAEIEFQSIHECSGDTGVTAALILHGSPPFALSYTIKHDDHPERPVIKVFHTSRAELTLKPEMSGSYTYTFLYITDKNYRGVPLSGNISTTQHVHPLASANFVRSAPTDSKEREVISSCDGQQLDVELDLRGTPPFTIDLQLVGPKGSTTKTFAELKEHREVVRVPIPPDLDRYGGSLEIDLLSVEDANGCKRVLDVPGISVLVKRVKPTVKFYGIDGKREVTILENDKASLPLRLTGDGPWYISYSLIEPISVDGSNSRRESGTVERARISSANENIVVKRSGLYKLIDIKDSYCPGKVITEASTFLVNWVPKPAGVFDQRAGEISVGGSIIRPPVCEGSEDHVDVELQGRPPFQVSYTYTGQLLNHDRVREQLNFNSIQTMSRLQLRTLDPGHHEYHITHVGDTAYPLSPLRERSAQVARLSGMVLEQEVLSRPSAYFKTSGRVSYCMNDAFVPRTGFSDEGTVLLSGKAPFKVVFSIKNLASSEVRRESVEIKTNEWKLQFPNYVFDTVGPHVVVIESFSDASPCSEAVVDATKRTFRVDVAETAAIVPYDRRDDFCVGDILQFQLQGNAPWRVDYRFDGKVISATSKSPKFSRVAEKAGVFEVIGLAHQQASCQTAVSDIKMNIRELPSARVSHGNNIIEDIREGDQAEIVFTLIGEPPFTFTYQRASLGDKKASEVLETHTVSGVMGHEYSIYSALEGTWTVTFISDKYCRYPPAISKLNVD